ncbi:MAG: hypothetical protein PHF35_04050 [Candidatus Moranbacteria bacterium]|nr:hypothetical protein [Candidatus Moranbacteria bacterium]
MKIVAKVSGEKPELVKVLGQHEIKAKLVKGGVVVELPERDRENWNDPQTFDVPAEVNGATLFIDVAEEGGGMTNTGSGTVVCGLSGKALRPYYVPKGYCNADHAYFSVPGSVITITGYRRDDNVTIREHKIVREGNMARIDTEVLWEGELEFLPNLYGRYREAAEAAHRKGNCYHCRCVHYAAN